MTGNGTVAPVTAYMPFADAHGTAGHAVRWQTWDGAHREDLTIRWENEGFTVAGTVSSERIEYVVRLSAQWHVRQFLLFRDLDEPDLWLATDGHGRWGEMNGAHRTELDGCHDVVLACTPFSHTPPIRRLPLHDGHTAELPVVVVDPDSLAVTAEPVRYTRHSASRWTITRAGVAAEVEVDEHGLVVSIDGSFSRVD